MENKEPYYIYAYYEPEHLFPFYIGVGKGDRIVQHYNGDNLYSDSSFHQKLYSMSIQNIFPVTVKLRENLTKDKALDFEEYYIYIWGRISEQTGCLTNLMSGGKNPTHSKQTIKKMSEIRKTIKVSDETRQKMSNSSYGKPKSEESKKSRKDTIKEMYNGMFNIKQRSIEKYNLCTGKTVQIYSSIREAARLTDCERMDIKKVCEGQRKTTKGYAFRYVNNSI